MDGTEREDREQRLRKEAYSAAEAGCAMSPGRPSLRERVAVELAAAKQEARRAARLEELDGLLGKHPDIARILDLVDEMRWSKRILG